MSSKSSAPSRALRPRQRGAAAPSLVEPLEGRRMLALVGGVDPYNMGKGEWIEQVSAAMTNTGAKTTAQLAKYLKDKGVKWVAVQAGNGNNGPTTAAHTQWNKFLVDTFRNAGLKIFAYHSTYGGVTANASKAPTSISGEKAVRDKIMLSNPDGLIVNAQPDWEKNKNAQRDAEDYARTFKQKFKNKLLGHAPLAYAGEHKPFPYLGFGKHVDVVMPQAFWRSLPQAQTPEKMLADLDAQWKALYEQFRKDGHANAIKPLVPIGQGSDTSLFEPTPGAEIARFYSLLRSDADPASPFGYNGVSFWSAQRHALDHWIAIGNGSINAPTGSISGLVFNDADGDGAFDQGEPGVPGRIIFDDANNDGARQGHEAFTKTDANGNYTIPMRGPGVHRVRQELPAGWRQTLPGPGLSRGVTMVATQKIVGQSFGSTQLATLSGTVYHDRNGNGVKASDEPGLGGWTVFADTDKDGVLDANEVRATTNSKGRYTMLVPPGNYDVRQVARTGYRVTEPSLGYHQGVEIPSGGNVGRFFGNTTLTIISGYVFNDTNRDGIKDGGEAGLSQWRVFADFDGDGFWDEGTETSVLTDSSGRYRFSTLAGGTVRIQVFQPKGWTATVPGNGARKITLASGGTTSNKNFGEIPIT